MTVDLSFLRTKSFLFLLLLPFLAPRARADCENTWTDDVVLDHVRQTKKIPPAGWKEDGFYYLFSMNGADVYFDLEYQGGMSGEPVYSAVVFQIRGKNVESQCLNEVELGVYKFSVQPGKKTFTVSGASGCNDHSGDDCQPVTEKYHYVWNGLAFYTTADIARSKSNLKKLLSAIQRKDQKTIATLIKQPEFYPALSGEDVDYRSEQAYNDFHKSKKATFAVMNFEIKETLKALDSGKDPAQLLGVFSEFADSVFNIYDSEGSQRKIFPEDRAYTQLINDIGFTYQQLWERILTIKPVQNDSFERARTWLSSARNRDPQRAVVYLNLSDLLRVWNEAKLPDVKEEPDALLKSKCYGSKYVELMKKGKWRDKIPTRLTTFLGDKVGIAAQPECKKFIP